MTPKDNIKQLPVQEIISMMDLYEQWHDRLDDYQITDQETVEALRTKPHLPYSFRELKAELSRRIQEANSVLNEDNSSLMEDVS